MLIVSGALVGASGTLLTLMMGRAMNRSIANVLFGAFGQVAGGARRGGRERRRHRALGDRRGRGDHARLRAQVVFVPGYGLAVAQAQHDVRELADALEERGVDVNYAIHPVAGRMPGHMNVLLAEANVPVRPAVGDGRDQPGVPADRRRARDRRQRRRQPRRAQRPGSPIYGMPILNVDQAQSVVVLKRSMSPGFAGHRQPALPRPEDGDAVRRREGVGREAHRPRQGSRRWFRSSRPATSRRAVSPERALEAVRDAFVAYARGEWTMPPKVYVRYPAGDFRAMPALGAGHAC